MIQAHVNRGLFREEETESTMAGVEGWWGLLKLGTTDIWGPHNPSSVVGPVLYIVRCLAASLASTH